MAKDFYNVQEAIYQIKESHYNLIGRVLTQYARLEYSLTQWISHELKISSANASIIVGREGIDSKFGKLRKLYNHKQEDILKIKEMRKLANQLTTLRNVITHNPLIAYIPRSNYETLLCFATDKYIPNSEDKGKVTTYSEKQLNDCAKSLHELSNQVFDCFDQE